MRVDAVLFDLDGTLWDCVSVVTAAWQQVINNYSWLRGPVTNEEIASCMGFNMDEIGNRLFPKADAALRKRLLDECTAREHAYLREKGGILYPGVNEIIPKLAQTYKLAIVSNCQANYIECFFEITGLGEYFCDYESFGNTGQEKGDNIKTVAARMGCRHPVYVGDMIKDQLAADYAGIPYVFAAYGFAKENTLPQKWAHRIESFADLPDLLLNI